MAEHQLICVVHDERTTYTGKLFPLTEEKFEKLQDIVEQRKLHHSSKYANISENFPSALDPSIHRYHSTCYKNFTAVKKSSSTTSSTDQPSPKVLRSTHTSLIIPKGQRILERKCIFCHKDLIKYNYQKQKLVRCATKTFEDNIRAEALVLHDFNILRTVGDSNFTAIEVYYHPICRSRYSKKAAVQSAKNASRNIEKEAGERIQRRKIYDEASNALYNYIDGMVIKREKIVSFNKLYETFLEFLTEGNIAEAKETFLKHHLIEKIEYKYKGEVSVESVGDGCKERIVYKTGLNMTDALKAQFIVESEKENPSHIVKKAAYILRKPILAMKEKRFSEILAIDKLLNDAEDLPTLLQTFLECLYHGPMFQSSSEKFTRRMKSVGADIVFSVSNGKFIPAKHLALGLGLKSMTGKKEVVQILNKFGHSINYWLSEELETSMAEAITLENTMLPKGMYREADLSTCVAFDNYDENVETLSGKGSIHETVGICFQNQRDRLNEEPQQSDKSAEVQKSSRKRKFESTSIPLQPYRKRLCLKNMSDWSNDVVEEPVTYSVAEKQDMLWILTHHYHKEEIPMWIGYNSKTVSDNHPKQKVTYLRNHDEISTNPAMVLETLKITGNIAAECGQPYGCVTYDLAIAKPALQIQSMEAPNFDNIFIHFGSFHLFLAYFSALGKLMACSGFSHMLIESGVIAENSVKGVVQGRNYNRLKRLHPMLALALHLQHLKIFLSRQNIEAPIAFEIFLINKFQDKDTPVDDQMTKEIDLFLAEYNLFCNATRTGEHGATAQFWFMYIDYVLLYMKMSRAVRLNDVNLFTYCLPFMTNLFFITNHANYARWMVRYHQNLMNIDADRPGLRQLLENGGLSIKRSNIPFSATPIDQVLEETVNRDSASRLTGISALTNQPSAHLRWTITRSLRSEVVTNLKAMAGVTQKDDVCAELQKSRILRDNKDLDSLQAVIQQADPFDQFLRNDTLFNMETGKAASEKTKEFLLTSMEKGDELRKTFIEECKAKEDRFNESIKRQVISNFESENVKVKLSLKENKVKELGLTCELFGRLCCLALEQELNMNEILKFSLTPLPLSLVHIDESMLKTDKSQLLKHIEKMCSFQIPKQSEDCLVVDAMFLIHTLGIKIPETYGELSKYILRILASSSATRIDVVFDRYLSPSIKESERMRRRETETTQPDFIITSPHQKRPRDFQKALKNDNFKRAFTRFLASDWQEEECKIYTNNKRILFTLEEECYEVGSNEEIVALKCHHEEADARLFFHCENLFTENSEKRQGREKVTTVRTGDTDVVIIILSNLCRSLNYPTSKHTLLVDFGTGKSRHFINCSQIVNRLGTDICKSLTGFHCFTGSDCTAAFARKGKIRPLGLVLKNKSYQEAFSKLGSTREVPRETVATLEKFTCEMYGVKKENVNEARSTLFFKINKPKSTEEPFKNMKKMDASTLPPCQTVLHNKIRRTNFICTIWNNAGDPDPLEGVTPTDSGWDRKNGTYVPQWDTKYFLPENVKQLQSLEDLVDSEDVDDDLEEYSQTSDEECEDEQ